MTPRHVADDYHVSPQISPEDAAALRAAGFRTVICNRPDGENPPDMCADQIRQAVEAEGLVFLELPFSQMTMTADTVAQQSDLIANAEGPILAYCASGNRCTVIWALGEASKGRRSCDDILSAAAQAGYDLRGIAPTLAALAGET